MSSYNINFYLAKGIFLGKLKNVKCKDKASVFFNRDKASDSNQFSMNFNWSRPIFTKYLNHRVFFFFYDNQLVHQFVVERLGMRIGQVV